jgi:hypothetical protein
VSVETCSFCGRGRDDCEFVIAGPPLHGHVLYVCDQCTDILAGIAADMRAGTLAPTSKEPA